MLKKIKLCCAVLAAAGLLTACAMSDSRPQAILYDLGPENTENTAKIPSGLPVLSTKVYAQEWLNKNMMVYRLEYENSQQVRFYTESTWKTTPARLLKNRLDTYLVEAGNMITGVTTSPNALNLRIYLEDFSQNFSSTTESRARIAMRVTIFKNGTPVAQKPFVKEVPCPTPDAKGGVKAMAEAADAVIGDIVSWVKTSKH